jgi:DNA-binding transcriptional ArsR family regulator
MDEYSRQPHSSLDDTLGALADPTRRSILDRLSRGEARVTEIAASFPISLNSVSKHIRRLERARLVERRVVGRDHLLRMRPQPLDAVAAWIARQTAYWGAHLQALDEHLQRQQRGGTRKREKR